jgi:hypothetical protein
MVPAPIIGLEHSGLECKICNLRRNSVREHINIQQNNKESSKIKQEKKGVQQV